MITNSMPHSAARNCDCWNLCVWVETVNISRHHGELSCQTVSSYKSNTLHMCCESRKSVPSHSCVYQWWMRV